MILHKDKITLINQKMCEIKQIEELLANKEQEFQKFEQSDILLKGQQKQAEEAINKFEATIQKLVSKSHSIIFETD